MEWVNCPLLSQCDIPENKSWVRLVLIKITLRDSFFSEMKILYSYDN